MTEQDGQNQTETAQNSQSAGSKSDTEELKRRGPGKDKVSFWQTMVSVVQASFGVQNKKNKQRDFENGSIKAFIAAALIFTVLFVLALVVVVGVVMG